MRGRFGPVSVTTCEACRTASELIFRYRGHPERSEAESKDPAALTGGISAGFLDFARNDMCQCCFVSSAQFTFHNLIDLLELRL